MLEVHPPEHTPHSWRDFFIHIATIVVGLLIAVGLEQTVEALHRHSERTELLDSLQHESEQIIRDTTRTNAGISAHIKWAREVDAIMADAFQKHHAIGPLPPAADFEDWDIPDNPIYKSAKASNKLSLISKQEAEAYGELDGLIAHVDLTYKHRAEAIVTLLETQRALRLTQPIPSNAPEGVFGESTRGFPALTGLSLPPNELMQLYNDSVRLEVTSEEFRYWSRQTQGAALVIAQGERNLHRIEEAESQSASQP